MSPTPQPRVSESVPALEWTGYGPAYTLRLEELAGHRAPINSL